MENDQGPKVIALPPQIYAGFIVSAFIFEYIMPTFQMMSVHRWCGGVALFVFGVTVMTIAIRTFAVAKTPIEPNRPTQIMVTTGIYQYSRNPMYIALTGIYLGIAISLSNMWMLFFLPALVLTIHFGVILKEEAYLTEKFGETYLDYKKHVRRWI